MEEIPGNNRNTIETEISKIRKDIAEIEVLGLAERYPELITRPNDTGLPAEQYNAWQKLRALRFMKEELIMLEGQLEIK